MWVEGFPPASSYLIRSEIYPVPERWMEPGWSDRGLWFPCMLRSKHQDAGSWTSELCCEAQDPYLREKKERLHSSLPLPGTPAPPCPLTFITHFLFMLGRNCGCSWWFEVRRDWPRVTLNKYTRTSQEGAGRLRLLPNHPWLISWQIQGDFLCTLSSTTAPSPPRSTTHQCRERWWNRGTTDQDHPCCQADGALKHSPVRIPNVYTQINAQMSNTVPKLLWRDTSAGGV